MLAVTMSALKAVVPPTAFGWERLAVLPAVPVGWSQERKVSVGVQTIPEGTKRTLSVSRSSRAVDGETEARLLQPEPPSRESCQDPPPAVVSPTMAMPLLAPGS